MDWLIYAKHYLTINCSYKRLQSMHRLVLYFSVYLFERHRERGLAQFILLVHFLQCLQQQGKTRLELGAWAPFRSLAYVTKRLKCLSHLFLPPRMCISKTLDWKQRSWAQSWHSAKGWGRPKLAAWPVAPQHLSLLCLHHSSNLRFGKEFVWNHTTNTKVRSRLDLKCLRFQRTYF